MHFLQIIQERVSLSTGAISEGTISSLLMGQALQNALQSQVIEEHLHECKTAADKYEFFYYKEFTEKSRACYREKYPDMRL